MPAKPFNFGSGAKPLDQLSGMPQMSAAFAGWMKTITLEVITQKVVNGFVLDAAGKITFEGTIQPLQAQQIMLKPEGQRSWEWLQIHCITSSVDLTTNDRIIYNGVIFKIMAVKDYSLNNYVEYHAVRDYQNEGLPA